MIPFFLENVTSYRRFTSVGPMIGWLSLLMLTGWSTDVYGQTVNHQANAGSVFIDTSEWVQSTSPISDGYVTQGYITETIVRGNRTGESLVQPVASQAAWRRATEFSTVPKIQPIVYESGTLVPNRPVSLGGLPSSFSSRATNPVFEEESVSAGLRGRATQATYREADSSIPVARTATSGSPASFQQTMAVPPTPHLPQTFSPPVFATAVPTGSFQQTQFVSPNTYPSPNRLQTYPQYQNAPPTNPWTAYPPNNSSYGPNMKTTWVPMIPLRSMPYGVYLGQGIIGQPVAYVDGEHVRNFLRYVFP